MQFYMKLSIIRALGDCLMHIRLVSAAARSDCGF